MKAQVYDLHWPRMTYESEARRVVIILDNDELDITQDDATGALHLHFNSGRMVIVPAAANGITLRSDEKK